MGTFSTRLLPSVVAVRFPFRDAICGPSDHRLCCHLFINQFPSLTSRGLGSSIIIPRHSRPRHAHHALARRALPTIPPTTMSTSSFTVPRLEMIPCAIPFSHFAHIVFLLVAALVEVLALFLLAIAANTEFEYDSSCDYHEAGDQDRDDDDGAIGETHCEGRCGCGVGTDEGASLGLASALAWARKAEAKCCVESVKALAATGPGFIDYDESYATYRCVRSGVEQISIEYERKEEGSGDRLRWPGVRQG